MFGNIYLGQSGAGNYSNEGVLHIPQSSGATPPDSLESHPEHTLGVRPFLLQRCRGHYSIFPDNGTVKKKTLINIRGKRLTNYISVLCLQKNFRDLRGIIYSKLKLVTLRDSSLMLCLSQRFGRCMVRLSSGGWNVELNPLFHSPG